VSSEPESADAAVPAIPAASSKTAEDHAFELGEAWDSVHDRRRERIKAMKSSRNATMVEAHRMQGLLETWRQVVVPVTTRWRARMRKAAEVPAYVDDLKAEWRRAVWTRPSRHWAGILIRWRLHFLNFFVLALALGKILIVVLFVVAMIYFILEWTGGGGFFK